MCIRDRRSAIRRSAVDQSPRSRKSDSTITWPRCCWVRCSRVRAAARSAPAAGPDPRRSTTPPAARAAISARGPLRAGIRSSFSPPATSTPNRLPARTLRDPKAASAASTTSRFSRRAVPKSRLADRSASLDFGTARREKREVVLAALAAFGSLRVRAGNRFGVLVAGGEKLLRIPARSGPRALMAALAAVYDTPRRGSGPAAGADLAAALTRLHRTQQRRGQVIVLSDFLDRGDWSTALRRIALRHQVIAVPILDPRELELPPVGMLALVDPETGQRLHVQTNSPALRERYAAAAAARQEEIRRAVLRSGAEYLPLTTDRDWLVDIAAFVSSRRGGGRRPVESGAGR